MGISKRQLEKEDAADGIATEICKSAGLLSECETCGGYKDSFGNPEEAYKLANSLFSQKHPLVEKFETREEITDAIKRVTDRGFNTQCECERIYESDPS